MRLRARSGLVLGAVAWLASGMSVHAQMGSRQPSAEGVVAWVGGEGPGPASQAILRSDVDLVVWLSGRTPVGERPTQEALREALAGLVREWIVWLEAQRLGAPDPSVSEVRAEQRRLLDSVSRSEHTMVELERRGVDADELRMIAERRAAVGAFLARAARGRDVSEQEVDQRLASGQHPFVGTDASQVRSSVRVWLQRQQHEQAIGRWVRALAQRTPVRYLAAWARPEDDATPQR